MSWNNGEIHYVVDWHTKGPIISADGMLYVYEEKSGYVGLVNPDPDEFDVVSSFQVTEGEGPHWAHPSIFDGLLFIRHGRILMVYDIKKGST
jgi:hypothetical protein